MLCRLTSSPALFSNNWKLKEINMYLNASLSVFLILIKRLMLLFRNSVLLEILKKTENRSDKKLSFRSTCKKLSRWVNHFAAKTRALHNFVVISCALLSWAEAHVRKNCSAPFSFLKPIPAHLNREEIR